MKIDDKKMTTCIFLKLPILFFVSDRPLQKGA